MHGRGWSGLRADQSVDDGCDVKDEFSKGSIPLGKVTQIQRHEHKKKFIFEIHTTVEGRVFYILAESEAVMKDWMDAITTTWMLHTMKYAALGFILLALKATRATVRLSFLFGSVFVLMTFIVLLPASLPPPRVCHGSLTEIAFELVGINTRRSSIMAPTIICTHLSIWRSECSRQL